jgi:hypothetical protein
MKNLENEMPMPSSEEAAFNSSSIDITPELTTENATVHQGQGERSFVDKVRKVSRKRKYKDYDEKELTEKILFKRIFEADWQKEGTIHIEVDGTVIDVEYDSEISASMQEVNTQTERKYGKSNSRYVSSETHRRIKAFKLKREDKEFSMRDFIKDEKSVYVRAGRDDGSAEGGDLIDYPLMVCHANITSIVGMNIFLHEIGHNAEKEKLGYDNYVEQQESGLRSMNHGSNMDTSEAEAVLASERFADAFALRQMGTFFRNNVDFKALEKSRNHVYNWYCSRTNR